MTKTNDEIIENFTKRLEYRSFSHKIIDDLRKLLRKALLLKQNQQDEKIKELKEDNKILYDVLKSYDIPALKEYSVCDLESCKHYGISPVKDYCINNHSNWVHIDWTSAMVYIKQQLSQQDELLDKFNEKVDEEKYNFKNNPSLNFTEENTTNKALERSKQLAKEVFVK